MSEPEIPKQKKKKTKVKEVAEESPASPAVIKKRKTTDVTPTEIVEVTAVKAKKPKSAKPTTNGKQEPTAPAAAVTASEPAAADPLALDNFPLSDAVKSMLRSQGKEALFPIQAKTLELGLAGRDVVGRARTGCGKTLAFVLPIVELQLAEQRKGSAILARGRLPCTICLAPTRELAKQVGRMQTSSANINVLRVLHESSGLHLSKC